MAKSRRKRKTDQFLMRGTLKSHHIKGRGSWAVFANGPLHLGRQGGLLEDGLSSLGFEGSVSVFQTA